ncbi:MULTISPECIES: cation diffusion facilitator family transporter [Paenibacillus]|jgi:cation diffusion facilitator family transporter|uniref:cation diffusion facilitator family transporter n=1 Tax=Paenibacillus TaxID=44249 RepID=UPI00048CFCED|nr:MULTISPECIES: cation diffusion facilitator family transporter [Paenibacillus]MEC2345901.1 cation diffusion facilitator family transporter [Paenibacillus barengoltzii]SMF35206.1 cation diffusion facilitator family transporter [Paenibacillus barengoltzii]
MTREQAVVPAPATWPGIAGDLVLAVFLGTVGLLYSSLALLAGALYAAYDVAVGVAARLSVPGKRRIRLAGSSTNLATPEPLPAIFFSVFLLMGTVQLWIAAITDMVEGDATPPETFVLAAVLLSMALRETLFQVKLRLTRRRSNQELQQIVEKHRHALFSSVVVLAGVFGAMAGQAWEVPVLAYLDPVAAILVALHVMLQVYRLVRRSIYGPVRTEVREEDASTFIETVQRVHGVITVDDLKAQENGHYVTVTAKISVNPKLTVMEANDIANRAKMLLLNRFSHVTDVRIQVGPYEAGYPYKSNTDADSDLPNLLQ